MFRQAADQALADAERISKEKEKAEQELQESEQKAQQAAVRVQELAPKLKNIEKLAADFSTDPEKILPEAGTLESAKSYREKKAKPLLQKIVKVLRGIYRAYLELDRQAQQAEKPV